MLDAVPWKMIGRYEDDEEIIVDGSSEEECMWKLCSLMDKHGNLVWYSGYSDEYYVDDEYIGRENFIYN